MDFLTEHHHANVVITEPTMYSTQFDRPLKCVITSYLLDNLVYIVLVVCVVVVLFFLRYQTLRTRQLHEKRDLIYTSLVDKLQMQIYWSFLHGTSPHFAMDHLRSDLIGLNPSQEDIRVWNLVLEQVQKDSRVERNQSDSTAPGSIQWVAPLPPQLMHQLEKSKPIEEETG
eukprot:TRINITY_DN2113_c0_g1_i2.p1 TRINITY_DN2113_c0_g1~~TRINITY_DN2113_c0_g1_i2.p1  ORF type:complete len:171 (-),score=50.38 TRINITY_DN2113_c0_g1_i2:583-1095(-)